MSRGMLALQDDALAPQVNRRAFLRAGLLVGVAAGGGLMLGISLPSAAQAKALPGSGAQRRRFEPNAFVRIDSAGKVTLVMPKVEMGQGVYTSLPMLIAEELEVTLAQVSIEHAPPDAKLYMDPLLHGQVTGGSTSIRYAWEPLRKAGATARQLLITAAAQRWKVDPVSCYAERGEVVHRGSGRRIGYGQLAESAAKLPMPENVVLKDSKDFKLIGTGAKRLDAPGKIDGTAMFGMDVRVPGMLYAVIVNCPVFGGTLASVDDRVARSLPGVRQVVKLDNAVAVVADHTWAAKRGASALVIQWNEGRGANYSTDTVVRELAAASKRDGAVARKEGDVVQGFKKAGIRLDAVYEQPFLAHATMEPVNCTVSVRADGCDIWTGTQVPTRAMDTAVKITGLPAERIALHNHLLGGGFGRRAETDFIAQALKVGKQVKSPVKVIWTREEDMQHDLYRPYYYDTISAALDSKGKPVAWRHRVVGSSIVARFAPPAFRNGLDPDAVEVAAELPYDLPNQLVDYVRQEPLEVPTTFWRGVGALRSTFVVESFLDELAARAKIDPVRYRLDLLGNVPRAYNVLSTVARKAGWGAKLPKGHAHGVSVMHAFGSFFAVVVEASVGTSGDVRVHRVVCAVDCGMVVNPDTIEAQIQGGIIFGITTTLFSEITIKHGRVEQSNFADYPMLRIHQTPVIDVHIVKSAEAPGGIGEPGTAVLPAALTNAIFAATGTRLRKLPVGRQLSKA